MYDPARDEWSDDKARKQRSSFSRTVRSLSFLGNNAKRPFEDETALAVADHYNKRPNTKANERSKSRILQLRTFNNFIKTLLINECTEPNTVVLDIACGKGGDLLKWLKSSVDGLIGVDIADVSIEHAKERYRGLKHKCFWVDFCAGDAFLDSLSDIVHPNAFPLDSVSCQFALHYAFQTEERIHTMLKNVQMALRPGGKFFGTIPDSEYLAENLRAGRTEWGNSVFKIKFEKPNPTADFSSMAGHKYSFFLTEAVEEVYEYVIPFDAFVKLAAKYDLKLDLNMPFIDYFKKNLPIPEVHNEAERSLLNRDGSFNIEPDQLEACSIYKVFSFIRV